MSDKSVRRFLNTNDQLTQWPNKREDKALALAYLATKFSAKDSYTEAQVNELLKRWHTFSDWPLLRRELFEAGYLDRTRDGSKYWLTDKLAKEVV